MVPQLLLDRVAANVAEHVRISKGYEEESMLNPLTPMDSVAAFAMAKLLTQGEMFDYCVSVAPEGHVYGYFFTFFSASILTVHVDYPPRRCDPLDDLQVIRDKRVLILEDDVASGTSLRHVVQALLEHQPVTIDLYLGRRKSCQTLENIDSAIRIVYLAEDFLDPSRREEDEAEFLKFFEYK